MLTIPTMPELWNMDEISVSLNYVLGSLAKWAVRQSPYISPAPLSNGLLEFQTAWAVGDHTPLTSRELESQIFKTIEQCLTIQSWGSPKNGDHTMVFVTRYEGPKPDNDFIDLYALARNVTQDLVLEEQVRIANDRGDLPND